MSHFVWTVLLASLFLGAQVVRAEGPAGLSFTESMSGKVEVDGKTEKVEFKFKAMVSDVEAWYKSPLHQATLEGYVKYKKKKYPAHGTLDMMTSTSPKPGEGGHYLTYRITFDGTDAPFAKFEGSKRVYNDHELDLLKDATTLRGKFTGGDCACSHPATIRFQWERPWVAAKFFFSFRTYNAGPLGSAVVMYKFLAVWLGGIYEEFFKILKPAESR